MITQTRVRLEYQDKSTGQWVLEPGSVEDDHGRHRLFPNEAFACARGDELRLEGKAKGYRVLAEDGQLLGQWKEFPNRPQRQFVRVA